MACESPILTTGQLRALGAQPGRPALTLSLRDILAQAGTPTEAGPVPGRGEVVYFAHGTTVATNTLIQGRGAPTGLITTFIWTGSAPSKT